MKTCVSVTSIVLFLLLQSVAARAQSNFVDVGSNFVEPVIATASRPHRYRELSIYTSGMLANPQLMSDLKNQRLFFTGVRLTSRLFTTRHLFIGGNLDVKPLIIHSKSVPNGREYTYGGGSGVGLQFAPRVGWHWQPFFDVDGGFVAFPHDVPMPNTRRVNMTLDFGPGVTIPLRGNNAMRTGVWLYHFSDGNTAPRNPAFDGVMVYVSYTFRNFSPHLSRQLTKRSTLDPKTDNAVMLQPERVQAGR
jgi:hypothetical protein